MVRRGRKAAEVAIERTKVLELYVAGMKVKEIASRLDCSERNVKYHIAALRQQGLLPPACPGPRPRKDVSPGARRRRSRRNWQWLLKTLRSDKLARELVARVAAECGRPFILPYENTTFYHPIPGPGRALTADNLALVAARAVATDYRVRLAVAAYGPDTETIVQFRVALRCLHRAHAEADHETKRVMANMADAPLLAAADQAVQGGVLTQACRKVLEARRVAESEARKVVLKLLRLQGVFEAGGDVGYALHKLQQQQQEDLRNALSWAEEAKKRVETQDQQPEGITEVNREYAMCGIPTMDYGQAVEELLGRAARFEQERLLVV